MRYLLYIFPSYAQISLTPPNIWCQFCPTHATRMKNRGLLPSVFHCVCAGSPASACGAFGFERRSDVSSADETASRCGDKLLRRQKFSRGQIHPVCLLRANSCLPAVPLGVRQQRWRDLCRTISSLYTPRPSSRPPRLRLLCLSVLSYRASVPNLPVLPLP